MGQMHHVFSRIRGTIQGSLRREIPSLALEEIRWDEDLYIYHHLGLGDMIHCNGMVRYLLSRLVSDRRIHVFCKARNAAMSRWMYRDEPRIQIVELDDRDREKPQVEQCLRRKQTRNYLAVGHRGLRHLLDRYPHLFFDELFYLQVGIPYSLRFEECYWERDWAQEERVFKKCSPQRPYAFVHDDPSRGYVVDAGSIDLPIVRNDPSESLFHMGLLLEQAAEVHCMESSIRCMIESLDMGEAQLYYHNFRYPERPLGTATRQNWISVEYTKQGTAIGA